MLENKKSMGERKEKSRYSSNEDENPKNARKEPK